MVLIPPSLITDSSKKPMSNRVNIFSCAKATMESDKNMVLSAIHLAPASQDKRKNATVEINVACNWKVAPMEKAWSFAVVKGFH